MLHKVSLINFKMNRLNNISLYNLAISDKTGETICFQTPDYHATNNFGGLYLIPPRSSDNQDMKWAGRASVETSTIDAFDLDVDLIKLDIEGMEDKAIQGASDTISRCRPAAFCEMTKTNQNVILDFFKAID